jgi:hypothetical protein
MYCDLERVDKMLRDQRIQMYVDSHPINQQPFFEEPKEVMDKRKRRMKIKLKRGSGF